jgi:hypothetical protein
MLKVIFIYKKTALSKMFIFMLENAIHFVPMFKTRTEENVFKEN